MVAIRQMEETSQPDPCSETEACTRTDAPTHADTCPTDSCPDSDACAVYVHSEAGRCQSNSDELVWFLTH